MIFLRVWGKHFQFCFKNIRLYLTKRTTTVGPTRLVWNWRFLCCFSTPLVTRLVCFAINANHSTQATVAKRWLTECEQAQRWCMRHTHVVRTVSWLVRSFHWFFCSNFIILTPTAHHNSPLVLYFILFSETTPCHSSLSRSASSP